VPASLSTADEPCANADVLNHSKTADVIRSNMSCAERAEDSAHGHAMPAASLQKPCCSEAAPIGGEVKSAEKLRSTVNAADSSVERSGWQAHGEHASPRAGGDTTVGSQELVDLRLHDSTRSHPMAVHQFEDANTTDPSSREAVLDELIDASGCHSSIDEEPDEGLCQAGEGDESKDDHGDAANEAAVDFSDDEDSVGQTVVTLDDASEGEDAELELEDAHSVPEACSDHANDQDEEGMLQAAVEEEQRSSKLSNGADQLCCPCVPVVVGQQLVMRSECST
jgi:hypothetical protein